MTETFDYRGKRIEVTASKVGKRWTWHYTIDGRNFKQNSEEFAPDGTTAISEGKWHAQGAIDRTP